MYPKHLEEERHRLRAYLRKTRWGVPDDVRGFLDDDDLLTYTDSMGGGAPARYRLDMMAGALLEIGVPEEKVRQHFRLVAEEPITLKRADWIVEPKYAAAIHAEVLRQLPELPEPGRGPAPVAAGFGQDVGAHPVHPAYTSGDFNVP